MAMLKAVRDSLALLSIRDRRQLYTVTAAQMATSLLDLIGVLLIGLVGSLSILAIQDLPTPPRVQGILETLGLSEWSIGSLVILVGLVACGFLLAKSLISTILIRRIFAFLAGKQAIVSARLTRDLLSQPLTFVHQRSSQETSYALVQGATSATLVLLGQAVIFVSEASLLFLLGLFLLIVNPIIAVASIGFFCIVAFLLQLVLGTWASRTGSGAARSDIASLDSIQEAISAYREITVASRRGFYVERIGQLRQAAARYAADLQFIGTFPKYVFEVALVIGGFSLATMLFVTQDAVTATGTLALFLASATRVMPSLLRLQTASLTMRNAAGTASSTIDLAQALSHCAARPSESTPDGGAVTCATAESSSFSPEVRMLNVAHTYPGTVEPSVTDASLQLLPGSSLAIVGPSGAGKSTLVDLILGVLEPQHGEVLLGSLAPAAAVARWPGAVSYVPQEVTIANSSIRQNIALGLPDLEIDDSLAWEAIARARLTDVVADMPEGLYTVVGERGFRLSGGQRQRLGIARALYSRPSLLVLDEATSALDAQTEEAITQTILDLEGSVTTIVIAHRLSTIRNADQVIYLDGGRIIARGSFDEIRSTVPAFDRQASIMGLR